MKIVHLCLACFFPDGYSYQENMLPKYHKALGHEVEVIASLETFDADGKPAYLPGASAYINEHGIPVTRLAYRQPDKLYKKLKRYVGFAQALEQAAPDLLFVHGCQFMDIDVLIRYLKAHPTVRVFVDNHADFSNSAKNWLSKNVLHKLLWKRCAQRIAPYAERFYGVLPARVDFLRDVYGLPQEKCELLVMGADDDAVKRAAAPDVRAALRARYGIGEDDFLVMTGGKIDEFKTQTLLLMEAVQAIDHPRLRLIVFGSVVPALKARVAQLADGGKVQFIGWLKAEQTYDYFAASDLVVFPGRHSVLWEQAAGQGVPMVCKKWPGTTHVDVGGNVRFLEEDSVACIRDVIAALLEEPQRYADMLRAAQSEGRTRFSYSDIARRSIRADEA